MNPILSRVNTSVRYLMVHFLSNQLQLYIINEYPKSGGTWVGQMFGRAINVPFPRNRFPLFRESIMHGHYLSSWGMKNVVIVWRDGRDVMASWYHHCLFPHGYGNVRLVRETRKNLSFNDIDDVKKNLPEFIEYAFTRQRHPGYSWSDFVKAWHNRNDIVYVRYEDLQSNTAEELKRIVFERTRRQMSIDEANNIDEEFSFLRMAGRQPGKEKKNSFLRKGIVGDWRNLFCQRAREIFDLYAGDCLIKLGYEEDHAWVQEE